jgi:hypothetical protein
VKDLEAKKLALSKALEARRGLIQERRRVRSSIFVARRAFADRLNQSLAETVVDYHVKVRFEEGVLSREIENIIRDAMNWRTSAVPRAAKIVQQVPYAELLDAIAKRNGKSLEGVLGDDRMPLFTRQEAQKILEVLSQPATLRALERASVEDRPEILVTRESILPDGRRVYPVRDFARLSLGQQQSVLLSILLFSTSNEPLVIDQPEDNLDSEFIYKTFVRSLRKVKETRQVIVVTHNANIAVLGDAELIVPLRASSDKSVIRDRGSIDSPKTKELACTILEGSADAFRKRMRMYNH